MAISFTLINYPNNQLIVANGTDKNIDKRFTKLTKRNGLIAK